MAVAGRFPPIYGVERCSAGGRGGAYPNREVTTMNRKLTLDPETLMVDSFEAVDAKDPVGTVEAHEAEEFEAMQCNTRLTCSTRLC